MPIPILMPALSPTMEEGTLTKWLVNEGDNVVAGDIIAEIETDKATMEVEAVDDGRVGKILISEGTENVAVNAPIALILEEGEDNAALAGFDVAAGPAAPPPPSSAQISEIIVEPAPEGTGPKPVVTNGQGGRPIASPLARRLASDNAIDLGALSGSGPHGRIVKRDVEKALEGGFEEVAGPKASTGQVMAPRSAAAVPAMSDEDILALYEPGTYEVVPIDKMRRIIATRLTQAKQTIPHFRLEVDCELDALLAARKRLNAMSPADGPKSFRISVNDMIIKAMGMALQKVPDANATWTEHGILRHMGSDIGVAVAVEGGLFTPVIRHAEIKSLSEISNEMKDLAGRARERRLAPHEYKGGTTSISNLGMMGVKSFDAVINPPQATILAVGSGEKRPIVKGDEIKIVTLMSCTLACDHRVVDGALGANLLTAFKGFIEEPVTMLV
jgi:pyruvate dehydrogenase E2 component (dihydrolipoamide acetyltransferase)